MCFSAAPRGIIIWHTTNSTYALIRYFSLMPFQIISKCFLFDSKNEVKVTPLQKSSRIPKGALLGDILCIILHYDLMRYFVDGKCGWTDADRNTTETQKAERSNLQPTKIIFFYFKKSKMFCWFCGHAKFVDDWLVDLFCCGTALDGHCQDVTVW